MSAAERGRLLNKLAEQERPLRAHARVNLAAVARLVLRLPHQRIDRSGHAHKLAFESAGTQDQEELERAQDEHQ